MDAAPPVPAPTPAAEPAAPADACAAPVTQPPAAAAPALAGAAKQATLDSFFKKPSPPAAPALAASPPVASRVRRRHWKLRVVRQPALSRAQEASLPSVRCCGFARLLSFGA